jgi:hypothetical protein
MVWPYVAAAAASLGGSIVGSLVNSGKDKPNVDFSEFKRESGRSTVSGDDPYYGRYKEEGEAAADRLDVQNPFISDEQRAQEEMRRKQMQYISDLRLRATGEKSLTGESAKEFQGQQRGDLLSRITSQRGRYNAGLGRGAMSAASDVERLGRPEVMAAMAREREAAQLAMAKGLGTLRDQDIGAMNAEIVQQDIERNALRDKLASDQYYAMIAAREKEQNLIDERKRQQTKTTAG